MKIGMGRRDRRDGAGMLTQQCGFPQQRLKAGEFGYKQEKNEFKCSLFPYLAL